MNDINKSILKQYDVEYITQVNDLQLSTQEIGGEGKEELVLVNNSIEYMYINILTLTFHTKKGILHNCIEAIKESTKKDDSSIKPFIGQEPHFMVPDDDNCEPDQDTFDNNIFVCAGLALEPQQESEILQ